MGDSMTAVTFARALERLAIVGAGILCVWFGYHLFAIIPVGDSTLGLNFGSYVINVTKVAPGIVFAGFGIFLLWRCLSAVITIKQGPDVVHFGFPAVANSTDPVRLKNDVAVLNAMAAGSRAIDPADIERVAHQARVALLAQSWDPAWGDAAVFAKLKDGDIPGSGPVSEIYNAQSNPQLGIRDRQAS
jgi:hypothetical protein